jgi:hypothetical protein
MVVVGELADVMVGVEGPLTKVHTPVPLVGAVAAMVTVPVVVQMV